MTRNRKGRSQRRGGALSASLKLGVVFLLLITVNIYVLFLHGETSLPAVLQKGALWKPKPARTGAVPTISEGSGAPELPLQGRDAETRIVEGSVASGESFRTILANQEVPSLAADALIAALGHEVDFRTLRAGVAYRFEFNPEGVPDAVRLALSPVETLWVRREGETYRAMRQREKLDMRVEQFGGVISRSLYDSLDALGEDTSLIGPFVDVFAWDLDFYIDQHPGDRFRMIVEKRYLNDAFYDYGRILAVEYAGRVGTFRAFWHEEKGGRGGYFDDKGVSLERSLLKTPLKYVRVSSGFGNRYHPILHHWKGHMGTDFAAPEGTPVRAAASGRVAFAGRHGGSGNMVVLSHGDGLTTLYMHLSRFAKGLHASERVEARQVIGYVGMTGLATGPHLHFAVKRNGTYVDPMKLRATRGRTLAGAALEQFKAEVEPRIVALATVHVSSEIRQTARGVSPTR